MSTYRREWACCGSVTETDAWEPEFCPFCVDAVCATPSPANGAVGEMPACELIYSGKRYWSEDQLRAAVLAERNACEKACADSFTGFGGPIDDPAQDSILINGAIRDCITAIRART